MDYYSGFKKEVNPVYDNVNEPGWHYAKWNKLDTKTSTGWSPLMCVGLSYRVKLTEV